MSTSRRVASLAAALLVVGVAVATLVRTLVLNADEIADALDRANWWWVGGAALLALVSVPMLAERWRAALGVLDESMPLPVAVRLFSAGQLGKYAPGGVWQFVGQGELATRYGIPRRAAYASVMLSTVTLVGGAALLVAAAGITPLGRGTPWWAVAAGGSAVAALAAPQGRRLVGRLLRLEQPIPARLIMRTALGTAPFWLVVGLSTWMVASSMVDVPVGPVVTAAITSWLAGIVFLPAPGGIGVREAVFATALTSIDPAIGHGTAAIIALVARALYMCADVAWLPLGRLTPLRRQAD
ncbi:MAG: lysylphosphatidylglycerol synthase domain-containing protein [Ilumatobacteraceae bacterium]